MTLKDKQICVLTSAHQRYDSRIYLKECRSLAKSGYDVSLVVCDGKGDEIAEDGIKIFDVGVSTGRFKRFTFNSLKLYRKARQINADIYHFHDVELCSIANLLKAGKHKVIYDAHEDMPRVVLTRKYIPYALRKCIAGIIEKIEDFSAKRFDAVISATQHINDRFKNINSYSVCIENFPIMNGFSLLSEWDKKKNEVCYIGGAGQNRGIIQLVQSLKHCDVILNLAGNFSRPAIKDQLAKMPEWQKVRFYGWVNREQVIEIMQQSKAGLLTWLPEAKNLDALPIKLFEYMAAGIPVIVSNFEGWKRIVEEHNCGVCANPEDPKEIGRAIEFILSNDETARVMGANGQKAVQQVFNWKFSEAKLLSFYKDLI